jgi:hypothetical protein
LLHIVCSLITNIIIFVVLFLVFLVLVKKASLAVIFYSKRVLRGTGPPDPKLRGAFQWLTDAIKTSDTELAESAGLDALVYITLFKTGKHFDCLPAPHFGTRSKHSQIIFDESNYVLGRTMRGSLQHQRDLC